MAMRSPAERSGGGRQGPSGALPGAEPSAVAPLPPGGLAEARNEQERAALLEAGRLLFALPCTFFYAAQQEAQLPDAPRPEIAFAGRSNVGKSSAINAVTGHNALARVSGTPGRTRQLNFFDLGGRLTLVDMPGYGYAAAPQEVKRDWQGLMFSFLRGRPSLRRVVLLIDAGVGFKPADEAAMDLLDQAAVAFQIVLTKSDRLKPPALAAQARRAGAVARAHTAAHPLVLATSSRTGEGFDELRAELAALALA